MRATSRRIKKLTLAITLRSDWQLKPFKWIVIWELERIIPTKAKWLELDNQWTYLEAVINGNENKLQASRNLCALSEIKMKLINIIH